MAIRKSNMPTVAISYGFAEGPWHGRGLKRALKNAGFSTATSLECADIIIAHSAGSYEVPKNTNAQVVVHIGYTLWPGKSIATSLSQTLHHERKEQGLAKWIYNSFIHDLHILNIPKTWQAYQDSKDTGHFLDILASKPDHIFVRNQHDYYCNQEAVMQRAGNKHVYISIPIGTHNTVWYNPKPYVTLLQSIYNKR